MRSTERHRGGTEGARWSGALPVGEHHDPFTELSTEPSTCIRAVFGRSIRARHMAGCEEDCDGCQPCPWPHCWTCRREHATDTCSTCLMVARANLATIVELVGHLPSQVQRGRQAWHHHHGIPGGDAMVMLVPAAPGWPLGHTGPVTTELPGDPRPPLDVLTHWTNNWRAHTANPTQLPPTMARVCDYLDGQLHLLARTQAFPALARDLARVRCQTENVLHAGLRPDTSQVPCWDCGARLVRVWAEAPEDDFWRCPVCSQPYDQHRYQRAQHMHLLSRGADRYVALTDAVAVTGRPERTVRSWVRDGLVNTRRSGTGRVEVWWPDVRDRHRVTPLRAGRAT